MAAIVLFIAMIPSSVISGTGSPGTLEQWWRPIAFHIQLATLIWLAGSEVVLIPLPLTSWWRGLRVCIIPQAAAKLHIQLKYATAADSMFISYNRSLAVRNVTAVLTVNCYYQMNIITLLINCAPCLGTWIYYVSTWLLRWLRLLKSLKNSDNYYSVFDNWLVSRNITYCFQNTRTKRLHYSRTSLCDHLP